MSGGLPASCKVMFGAAAVAALLTDVPPTLGCDSTGCLLATRGRNGALRPGVWALDLSYRYTDQADPRRGSAATDEVVRPLIDFEGRRIVPDWHEELGGQEQFLQVDAAYGLASRVTLVGSVPLMARRYYRVSHFGYDLGYSSGGIGDAVVGARVALTRGKSLVAGLAVKLPSGESRKISFLDRTIQEPSFQAGSGSWDLLGSAQYVRRFARGIDAALIASYQRNSENSLGFRFGDERLVAVAFSRPGARFSPSLQMKVFHKERSRYLSAGVASTGGTIVYLTPGVRLAADEETNLYLFVQKPIHRRVNEAQLTPRFAILGGFAKTF